MKRPVSASLLAALLLAPPGAGLAPRALADTPAASTVVETDATEAVQPLSFDSEILGREGQVFGTLRAAALALLAREPDLGPLDVDAESLRRGDLARALAEGLRAADSAQPALAARGKARCAWVLARAGAVNFAAEFAGEAMGAEAARGETFLARAWMLRQAANDETAASELARASSSQPPPPRWAVEELRAYRAAHAAALERFLAAPIPDESTGDAALDRIALALASGARHRADTLLFSAIHNLEQERSHAPDTPGLAPRQLRAARADRDNLLARLVPVPDAPPAPEVLELLALAARDACVEGASSADWRIYFDLLHQATRLPGFDFTPFYLEAELAAAARSGLAVKPWQTRFAAQLADPRLRHAASIKETLDNLEKHPGAELLNQNVDAAYSPEEQAAVVELVARLPAAETALAATRPAGGETVPSEKDFQAFAALARMRLALIRGDGEVAGDALVALKAADRMVWPGPDQFAPFVAELEHRPLLAVTDRLEAACAGVVPDALIDEARRAEARADAALRRRLGDEYLKNEYLSPADLALVRTRLRLGVLVASTGDSILATERALAEFERVGRPDLPPENDPAFASARAFVAAMPLDRDRDTLLRGRVETGDLSPEVFAELEATIAAAPDRWSPRELLAIARWKQDRDDLAAPIIAELRRRAPVCIAARDQLDALEQKHDPAGIVRASLAQIDRVSEANRDLAIGVARFQCTTALDRLVKLHARDGKFELADLPPHAVRGYSCYLAGLGRAQLAAGDLASSLALLHDLENLPAPGADPGALALLQPAVRDRPFTQDLPDDAMRAAMRAVLAEAPPDRAALGAMIERLPAYNGTPSISNRLLVILIYYRNEQPREAAERAAKLRKVGRANLALRAQLDALDELLPGAIDFRVTFGESADSILERHNRLALEHINYLSRNQAEIDAAYANNTGSHAQREIEAMEKRIAEVRAEYEARLAEEQKQERRDAELARAKERRVFPRLRELMAL